MLFKALIEQGDATPIILGGVPKRSNGAGCKPVDFGLRKFESFPLHHSISLLIILECYSWGCAGVVQW